MDSLAPAELLEITIALAEATGLQYQYWLAASFATIVATYSAGQKLNITLKTGIAFLYVLASVLFALLYISNLIRFNLFTQQLAAHGIDFSSNFGTAITVLRFLVWSVGTALTIWFIFYRHRTETDRFP